MTSSIPRPSPADVALRQVLETWRQAAGRRDMDALMACYAPDVVAYDAIQSLRFQGREAYGAHWRACLDTCPADMQFGFRDLDIRADGHLAYAHALISCGQAGEEPECWSRMTTGFRQIDGHWLIAHEHFSFPCDMGTGKALMSLSPDGAARVQPIPSGMNTVTPHLVCADAASAVDFYCKAFGASVMARLDAPQGGLMHACLRIGDSAVMLMEESPECQSVSPATLKGTPVTIHLYVRDADAAFRQAVEAGAIGLMEPQDMFWGDRYGLVKDPYGHQWSLATHVRDLDPAAIQQAAAEMFAGRP